MSHEVVTVTYTVESSLSWGPMFVAFLGNPCQRIYIPTKVYRSISSIFITNIQDLLPTKLRPDEPEK